MGIEVFGHIGLFQVEWSANTLITDHTFVLLAS